MKDSGAGANGWLINARTEGALADPTRLNLTRGKGVALSEEVAAGECGGDDVADASVLMGLSIRGLFHVSECESVAALVSVGVSQGGNQDERDEDGD